MDYTATLKLTASLYIYALTVFLLMQMFSISTGGSAAQEPFELFADPTDYAARMRAAGDGLRIMLLADLFFIIGFGTAIGMTAYTYADRNRVAAWAAGLGILAVMALDLTEDIYLILSVDIVDAGVDLPVERILAQAQISAAKWLASAVVIVVLTFTLPDETPLERLLIWSSRVLMPLGAGLFVTGAFDARDLGGLVLLLAMGVGLGLLALTTGLRARRSATEIPIN